MEDIDDAYDDEEPVRGLPGFEVLNGMELIDGTPVIFVDVGDGMEISGDHIAIDTHRNTAIFKLKSDTKPGCDILALLKASQAILEVQADKDYCDEYGCAVSSLNVVINALNRRKARLVTEAENAKP